MASPSEAKTASHDNPTPVMRQYLEAKRQYSDAIVFFRMGDFYEMFYEDALTAARALELTLTSRSKDSGGSPIPMCGIPHHAVDGYITRLVKRGFRVALCEQVEDAKKAKKLVRREVVRVVSPGTLIDAGFLDAKEPAFLMALARDRGSGDVSIGVALIDLSTGEFTAAEYAGDTGAQAIADEMAVLRPREIIVSTEVDVSAELPAIAAFQLPTTALEPWSFGYDHARTTLCTQLQVASLEGIGLDGHPAAIMAAGALVQYLQDTQKVDLEHVRRIAFRSRADYLLIDPTTFKHLEILEAADGGLAGSLLGEIDRTATPMGGRLLRAWLQRPVSVPSRIQDRLDAVEELAFRNTERTKLQNTLRAVHDLERLVARVALGTAGPRDLVGLRQSVTAIPRVRVLLDELQAPLIKSLVAELDDVVDVREAIDSTLVDEPPALARDGGCIRDGVDVELDDLRSVSRDAKQHIAAMEQAERDRTGIASLKIRYNRVYGYYIEVSKSNLHAVPDDYQRKQTVATGERFITPALKDYEQKALGADERILEKEQTLFDALRAQVAAEATRVQVSAQALAALDVLAALAETATLLNYTKPRVNDDDELNIVEGRHPVVERHCPDPFVPNDVLLNSTTQQLVILTGPNMGGKSTYLRQTALIVLLATSARSYQHSAPRFRSSTGSSLASARQITSPEGNLPSYSRCRKPRRSSTPRRHAASCCSTRSGAARRPSTASASRGRSPSTWRPTRVPNQRRSSPPIIMSSLISPIPSPAWSTIMWWRVNGTTTSSFCGRLSPAGRTGATGFRSRVWPAFRRKRCSAPRTSSAVWNATSCRAEDDRPSAGGSTTVTSSSDCFDHHRRVMRGSPNSCGLPTSTS